MTYDNRPPIENVQTYPVGQPMRPHRGMMVLVFGILGLLCCLIFGIIAWIMGSGDLKEMDAGRMDPSGRGLTQAGKICGIISVILTVALLAICLLGMIAGVGSGMMSQ